MRLVQEEEFSGFLAFLMWPVFGRGEKTRRGFEGFNEDLRRRVEGTR